MATTPTARAHGPWVDLHAHPGRCFLAGLAAADPLAAVLGPERCAAAMAQAARAGMAVVSFDTVADLRVLGIAEDGGLCVARDFDEGEAGADHERQLDGVCLFASSHAVPVVRIASDVVRAHEEGTCAVLLGCEGADFLEDDLARLEDCHAAGVRTVTLVHYRPNDYGDTQTESARAGLTPAGRELVGEMNRLGMVVDVAHATFETTLGVLEASSDPVMLSHSHLAGEGRTHPRLLAVEHARAVAAGGGLVGAWPSGVTSATFGDFVDEVVRLIEAVGVDHVGIGTDMDANFRPVLTDYAEFGLIGEHLSDRGFTPAEGDRVLGGNALDLLATVCG